ncbi:MAG: HlyD family efflux transporter periplasmic adaptor subunit, partial [Anaerolineales bacterium]|nr:HlyD family efflux transporter periplasmic adaptor subunit [Anaerolineales bacterium]
AANAVEAAKHQVEAAQANLDRVLARVWEEELDVARAAVTQARSKVAESELSIVQAETFVQIVEAQLEKAQSLVQTAQLALERRTLTAPFSGNVAEIPVRLGEMVPAGMSVVSIAGESGWQVKTTDLTELNVASISPGMDVAVYVDAFPETRLHGQVTDIAEKFGESYGDVTYQVTVDLTDSELNLRWGMTAIVQFSDPAGAEPAAAIGIREPVAEGKIVPASFANLSFEIGGAVADLLVREGDMVQAGDPIIRLDSAEIETALAQAQAGVDSAQAALAAALADQLQAEAAITTAQGQVAAAEAQLALVQVGARLEDIAAARSRLAAAESAVAQAAASRDAALDIGTPSAIQAAERDVANAMAVYQPLQQQYDDILNACVELPNGSDYCPLYGPVEEITRASVEAAKAALTAAQAALDLLKLGATPAQERTANAAVTVAAAHRDAAAAELDLLLAGATPEQIDQAEIGVEQARAGVQLARIELEKSQAAIQAAQAALSEAQAGYRAVEANIDRAVLRAPFSGIIASLDARIGEQMAPGIAVVTLIQKDRWQVETIDLTELVIAQVEMGAPVKIQIDAMPNNTLSGIVSEIALVSNQYQGDVVYRVSIDLEDWQNLKLRWGMTTQVDFSR